MQFARRIERLRPSLVREILEVAGRPDVISFAGGLPASERMPAPELAQMPPGLRQYGATEGELPLRTLVAEYLGGTGLDVAPEQVIITAGSQQGIDLVSKLFVEEGAPVLVEDPTYLAALQCFTLLGARYRPVALDNDGPDIAALHDALTGEAPRLAYLIPDFQNPSGCCYAAERRRQVALALAAAGVPLVEDAPYRELVFEPVDRTPVSVHLPAGSPFIYLGSFSKVAVPALRIGYMVASPELVPLLTRLKQGADLHTSRPAQWWLARFLESGGYQPHLEGLRAFYRERRQAMAEALDRHFGAAARWQMPAGGLFFWVRLSADVDTLSLLRPALERGVAFMPGAPFCPNGGGERYMRINFSHAPPERIDEGVRRLAALVEEAVAGNSRPERSVPEPAAGMSA